MVWANRFTGERVMTRYPALTVACVAVLATCTQDAQFQPVVGTGRHVELALDGVTVSMDLDRPAVPLLAPDARMVTIDASGVQQEEPIAADHGCIRTGPVRVNGQVEQGAWAVASGCQALHITASFHGVLWDVQEDAPGRASVWTTGPTPILRDPSARLTVTSLPANQLHRAAGTPTKFVELSVYGDAAYAVQQGANGLTNALAVIAVAKQFFEDGLTPATTLVMTHFTQYIQDPFTFPPPNPNGEIEVDSLLSAFRAWEVTQGVPRDAAVLLSGRDFQNSVTGYAGVGTMCYSASSHAIIQHTFTTAQNGVIVAHYLGHMVGMNHDSVGNTCPPSGYVMAAVTQGSTATQFSQCSQDYYASWLSSTGGTCMDNAQTESTGERCGDGIVQQGEECDCGVNCDLDLCCNGNSCVLTDGAVCSALEPCCDSATCQPQPKGHECAPPQRECNLGGICQGPANTCFITYAPPLTMCHDGFRAAGGTCWNGTCHSSASQCSAFGKQFSTTLSDCSAQLELETCGRLQCATSSSGDPCYFYNAPEGPLTFEDGITCHAGSLCIQGVCTPVAEASSDLCPTDPTKMSPGQCGCGALETNQDGDDYADCVDACPMDPYGHQVPCSAFYNWVVGDWSDCNAECDGTQTRTVVCQGDMGNIAPAAACPGPTPISSQSCNACQWVTGAWSQCSAACNGTQDRAVNCVRDGQPISAVYCTTTPPEGSQSCNPCTFSWQTGEWSTCSANCDGEHTRAVQCVNQDGVVQPSESCTDPMPASKETCNPCQYTWSTGAWSACSAECNGTQTRAVVCLGPYNVTVDNSRCTETKPDTERACQTGVCSADGGVPSSSSEESPSSSVVPGSSTSLPADSSSSLAVNSSAAVTSSSATSGASSRVSLSASATSGASSSVNSSASATSLLNGSSSSAGSSSMGSSIVQTSSGGSSSSSAVMTSSGSAGSTSGSDDDDDGSTCACSESAAHPPALAGLLLAGWVGFRRRR